MTSVSVWKQKQTLPLQKPVGAVYANTNTNTTIVAGGHDAACTANNPCMYTATGQTGASSIMVAQGDRILAAADNCVGAQSIGYGDTHTQVAICDNGSSIRMNPTKAELTIIDIKRGSVTIKDSSHAQ